MPRPRRPVHFEFKAHTAGERYKRVPKGVKTHISENFRGIVDGTPLNMEPYGGFAPIKTGKSTHPIQTTRKRVFTRALKNGKTMLAGETGTSTEISHLEKLIREYDRRRTLSEGNIDEIKELFRAASELYRFRHYLTRKTIRKAVADGQTPLTARFGTGHSLLSSELKKEGILSSRNKMEQLFDHSIELIRKLQRGQTNITDEDYLRGFASWLYFNHIEEFVIGKPMDRINDRDERLAVVAARELLKSLSKQDLEKMIQEGNIQVACKRNHLSFPPNRKEILHFLEKNSAFYRNQRAKKRLP